MPQWLELSDTLVWWLVIFSLVTFIASLVAVPWLAIRMPADYFVGRKRHNSALADANPAIQLFWRLFRNLLGACLVFAGILMLVLPGQGLLAIVAGLMLMSFPGKRRLARRIVSQRVVHSSIDAIRRRAGKAPILLDPRHSSQQ